MKHETKDNSLSASPAKIKKEVYKAYCDHGQSSAFDVANKYPDTVDYEYCKGCETDSPILKGTHECLICGQETKLLSASPAVGDLKLGKYDTLLWTFKLVYDGRGKFTVYANGVKSYTTKDCETAPEAMAQYFEMWDTDKVVI